MVPGLKLQCKINARSVDGRIGAQRQAGGKAPAAAGQHALVHGGKNLVRAMLVMSQRVQRPHQQRNGQRDRHTLSAYVASGGHQAAVQERNDLEDVPAHLSGGLVDALDLEAGDGSDVIGDKFNQGSRLSSPRLVPDYCRCWFATLHVANC